MKSVAYAVTKWYLNNLLGCTFSNQVIRTQGLGLWLGGWG